jgi:hypothetical protein
MFPMILAAIMGQVMKTGNESKTANDLKARSDAINPSDPTYKPSPYAQERLGLAQTLLNARMPGATAMERNIYGNQANQQANIERNATSGSQALAMGAAAQGQTNQAFQNLGVQEQQDYYNRAQNLSGAQAGMTQEGDKVYQDQLRDYQEKQSLKNAYLGAAIQNKQTAYNSFANMGTAGIGIASQLGDIFKGYKNIKPSAARSSFMGMTPEGQGGMNDSYMPGQMNPNMKPSWMQ